MSDQTEKERGNHRTCTNGDNYDLIDWGQDLGKWEQHDLRPMIKKAEADEALKTFFASRHVMYKIRENGLGKQSKITGIQMMPWDDVWGYHIIVHVGEKQIRYLERPTGQCFECIYRRFDVTVRHSRFGGRCSVLNEVVGGSDSCRFFKKEKS